MRPVRSRLVVFYYLTKNRGWSAGPVKLYKLCAALSPPVLLCPPGKVIFLGTCRLPPRLRALTLGTMGAGGSLPTVTPEKGAGPCSYHALCRLLR